MCMCHWRDPKRDTVMVFCRASQYTHIIWLIACTCGRFWRNPACFFFIQRSRHTKHKITVRKTYIVHLHWISEPYNASRQPKHQFWLKWVKIVTFMYARSHAPHVARGRKTLQMHGFPIQTCGETSKHHNFNSKVWIKILLHQISRCDPFCMLM